MVMSESLVPTGLEELPPSAKLVYKVLQHADDPLTHAQIRRRSWLPDRTVRYAISRLEDAELVHRSHSTRDARQFELQPADNTGNTY